MKKAIKVNEVMDNGVVLNVIDYVNNNENKDNLKRSDMYKMIMKNLKPFAYQDGKVIMCSGDIPLELLYVDERYQGLRKHPNLNRLRTKWDITKLTPITLVPHPEEYRFAVVDGQGRCILAPEKGMDSLPAIILMAAPEDPEERLKYEASYFIGQGTEDEKLKPTEKHLSRVIVGDKAALIMENILNKYKVTFVSTKGNRSESVLGSYSKTYQIAKNKEGEECLEFIFSIIENAGWNQEKNGYSKTVIIAIRNIFMAHKDYREEIHELLSKELRQVNPELFIANGISSYPKRGQIAACSLYVEDIVCNALNIQKCIYVNNGRLTI